MFLIIWVVNDTNGKNSKIMPIHNDEKFPKKYGPTVWFSFFSDGFHCLSPKGTLECVVYLQFKAGFFLLDIYLHE